MSPTEYHSSLFRFTALGALSFALITLVGPRPANADDRRLFQAKGAPPYVFTLLDTSGSMHEEPAGGQALGAADAPVSRLYQAKSALWEVIQSLQSDINFGWAHFNQQNLRVSFKHWLYTRKPGQSDPPWWGQIQFPREGDPTWFGPNATSWQLENTPDLGWCGNYLGNTGATNSLGELREQLNVFPKLGANGQAISDVYIRLPNGRRYEVRFQATGDPSFALGKAEMRVKIRFRRLRDDCSTRSTQEMTMTFIPFYTQDADGVPFVDANGPLAFDFINWFASNSTSRGGSRLVRQNDFGRRRDILPQLVSNVCNNTEKWDPNDNTATGFGTVTPFTYPTRPDPVGGRCSDPTVFDRGDVIPWDWVDHPIDNTNPALGFERGSREEILARLAPNTVAELDSMPGCTNERAFDAGGNPIPDFRVARYFQDVPGGNGIQLTSCYQNNPPITNRGLTPLEGVMRDLADWHSKWEPCAQDPDTGDPFLQCRQRFLILLTDGLETCGGNPGSGATALFNAGVRVFVVGFGAGVTTGSLQQIADNGGTGNLDLDPFDGFNKDCEAFGTCPGPIVAANRQQLIDALRQILTSIEGSPTALASPTVPQARAVTADSIYISTFVPVDGTPTFPGRLFDYIQPLPLTEDAFGRLVPDQSELCANTPVGQEPRACLAWEADSAMRGTWPGSFRQVPIDPSEVNLRVGPGPNERRLYIAKSPPSAAPDKVNLATRLLTPPPQSDPDLPLIHQRMFDPTGVVPATAPSGADTEVFDVLAAALIEKTVVSPKNPNQTFELALGDVFHSDPVEVAQPNRPNYLISNLPSGSSALCRDTAGNFDFTKKGYRCFVIKNTFRRKVVLTGASDGMFHAFDAGTFDKTNEQYNVGTGQELFAFVPKAMMPRLVELKTTSTHDYGVDGPPRVDDVFIDPDHTGTPDPTEREWRTVVIAGLREGGSSYFALDITQPDPLIEFDFPNRQNIVIPDIPANSYVPTCMADTGYTATQCGPVPYGALLWEFEDPDLGNTWSKPNTGRIEVTVGGKVEERYVAIFGGGLDPEDLSLGHHLYIVDIETGKAIYKRDLFGPVPSAPAAVDRDGNGLLDTIYVGTFNGDLWKVDLSTPAALSSGQIGLSDWAPIKIFVTDDANTGVVEKKPIFFPPSVIFVSDVGHYALAFGTGQREDLWDPMRDDEEGRFYVILDTDLGEPGDTSTLPLREDAFELISATAADAQDEALLQPGPGLRPGYALRLDLGEKLISEPFALSGLLIFNTFKAADPTTLQETGLADLCVFSGITNVFSILTKSGNSLASLLSNPAGTPFADRKRFQSTPGFGSQPVLTAGSRNLSAPAPSGNPADLEELIFGNLGGAGGGTGMSGQDLFEALKGLYPAECKFGTAYLATTIQFADTTFGPPLPLPVCVQTKNWGEQ